MKINVTLLFLISLLFPAVDSARAQLSIVNGRTAKVARSAKSASKSVRAVKPPSLPKVPKVEVPALSPSVRPPANVSLPQMPSVAAPEITLRVQELERSVRELKTENMVLKATLNKVTPNTALLRGTFQAVETTDAPTNTFSGTVFKTVYNGEEEVFGVVAAHAVSKSMSERALKRHFTVGIFDGENVVEVPAEIVQLSSPSMLDVALVKFSPEAEGLFHPLRISEVPVKFGDMLASQGFAGNTDVNIPNRFTKDVTPLSIRTNMPYARDDRPGLCGSAVVNANQELVGIHTGSTYGRDVLDDVGYATNASFLNTLVEAYHNGGQATFPFILNKQKIADFNVDEYISYVTLSDESGKVLWQRGFESKFSYSTVQEMMEIYHPRFITVTTRRAGWNAEEPEVLFEDHVSPADRSKTTYKYDLQEQQLVSKKQVKKR